MLEKEILKNGVFVYRLNGKRFVFNIDYQLPKKKPKSMFQILQSIAIQAEPSAYSSKLSKKPATLEEFFWNLDKFMEQDKIDTVNFHYGRMI